MFPFASISGYTFLETADKAGQIPARRCAIVTEGQLIRQLQMHPEKPCKHLWVYLWTYSAHSGQCDGHGELEHPSFLEGCDIQGESASLPRDLNGVAIFG